MAIMSFGVEFVDGWMDGVELAQRVVGSQMLRPFWLSMGGWGEGTLTEGLHLWWGWDEGCGPPFNYTLAFALQLRKIMEILSLLW